MSPALVTQLTAALMYELVEEPGDGRHAVVRDAADPGLIGYGETIEEATEMLAAGRRLKQRMMLQPQYVIEPAFEAPVAPHGVFYERSATSNWEIHTDLNEALSA